MLWEASVQVPLSNDPQNDSSIPLHFQIQFPDKYPSEPPSIGFYYDIPYRHGAVSQIRRGGSFGQKNTDKLTGKYGICLDLLGNFAGHHSEWKEDAGSGWSPAYSVTIAREQGDMFCVRPKIGITSRSPHTQTHYWSEGTQPSQKM